MSDVEGLSEKRWELACHLVVAGLGRWVQREEVLFCIEVLDGRSEGVEQVANKEIPFLHLGASGLHPDRPASSVSLI